MVKRTFECVGGVTLPETDAKPISGRDTESPHHLSLHLSLKHSPRECRARGRLSPPLAISMIPFTPDVFYILVCARTYIPPPFPLTKLTQRRSTISTLRDLGLGDKARDPDLSGLVLYKIPWAPRGYTHSAVGQFFLLVGVEPQKDEGKEG